MRVSLVNAPPFQRVDRYDSPDFTRLGLACLASKLRQTGVEDIQIIDAKFELLSYDAIHDRLRGFRPDVVGLTAFTNEIKPAARVAEMVKSYSSSILTVIGGVHASVLPERTLAEFPCFDCVVVGEGEITLAELVSAAAARRSWTNIAGLCFTEQGKVIHTPERERVVDLDSLPLPAWDLLPPSPRYLFMTQRGCAYRCNFCANPNGRLVRARSPDNVIAGLEVIVARGGQELYMCDELFTANRARAHALLDAMISAGIGRRLRWSAQTHVNLVDRDLFAKMKQAGCFICGLGIETGDPEIMRNMKKGATMQRVLDARQAARAAGMPIEGLMIIGHPNETWASAMRTVNFTVKLNPERPIVGVMVPYPGTEVAAMAARGEGGYRPPSQDWNDYNKQISNALSFEHLSRRQLEVLQMLAYVKVFLWNRRWREFARFLWDYRYEGWAVVRKILFGRLPRPERGEHSQPASRRRRSVREIQLAQ